MACNDVLSYDTPEIWFRTLKMSKKLLHPYEHNIHPSTINRLELLPNWYKSTWKVTFRGRFPLENDQNERKNSGSALHMFLTYMVFKFLRTVYM